MSGSANAPAASTRIADIYGAERGAAAERICGCRSYGFAIWSLLDLQSDLQSQLVACMLGGNVSC